MAEIVLSTFNARYSHTALGLRYLWANLGSLKSSVSLLEFDIKVPVPRAAEMILQHEPRLVALSTYIWNAEQVTALVKLLRSKAPHVHIVLGGPEISFETEQQEMSRYADGIICGEGDLVFEEYCRSVQASPTKAGTVVHRAPPADVDRLALPYDLYSEQDLQYRLVYAETSRGCPFACDYCISSVWGPLRYFSLDRVLPAIGQLIRRGARTIKFVDRTFNANVDRAVTVLDFLHSEWRPGLMYHFEMVPDRFPEPLRQCLKRFPPNSLELEIGVQTFNPEVAARIHRRMNLAVVEDHLRFLRNETGAVLHVDLIAGLPGETWESIRQGFDRLVRLRPHRIQLGILKRLRGTPIVRHDAEWQMVYEDRPPYAIVRNRTLSAEQLMRIRRMSRFWDRLANRELFPRTLEWLRETQPSMWDCMMGFSDWFYERYGVDHGYSLRELAERLFVYLTDIQGLPRAEASDHIAADYCDQGRRRDLPRVLRLAHGVS